MAPYKMNHYLRKYLIKILCVLFYRRHHTFDVKTCFQQNRYVFDVMSVICFLYFVEFCPRYFDSFRAPDNIYKIIKINKTQLLLKYFFGARGVKFLEKRWKNVQILQALR